MPLPGKLQSYNLTKEEWQAIRNLAKDWSIIIKPADESLCVEGLCNWDREAVWLKAIDNLVTY